MKPRIGILGGGQLGKMLYQAGTDRVHDIHIMDAPADAPAAKVCPDYSQGDFTVTEDIISFGKDKEVVTIEIERINVDGLRALNDDHGVAVYPQPEIIALIQDKGLQKDFYKKNDLASSPYQKYDSITNLQEDITAGRWSYPMVQKIRVGGYDGRGVKVLRAESDLADAFERNFIVEEMVDIAKEIAVVTCRGQNGDIVCYDPVEMVFDPDDNILLYQLGPAAVSDEVTERALTLARELSDRLGIVGLLAIEMFLIQDGELLINEIAPRPHNSGHHTIEACIASQYENHIRAISGLPLGSPRTRSMSILYNLLGAPGHTGPVKYEGLNEVLAMEGIYVHLYGKEITKPARKMGHITILGDDEKSLMEKYNKVKETIKVISDNG